MTHTNQPEEKPQFQSSQTFWEALGNLSRISKDQYLSSVKKTNIEIFFLLFSICEITTGPHRTKQEIKGKIISQHEEKTRQRVGEAGERFL